MFSPHFRSVCEEDLDKVFKAKVSIKFEVGSQFEKVGDGIDGIF